MHGECPAPIAETVAQTHTTPTKTPPKAFNNRLRTLAAWLLKRADEPHNELTTRSMLRQKVEEALSSPNNPGQK